MCVFSQGTKHSFKNCKTCLHQVRVTLVLGLEPFIENKVIRRRCKFSSQITNKKFISDLQT